MLVCVDLSKRFFFGDQVNIFELIVSGSCVTLGISVKGTLRQLIQSSQH